MRKWVILIFLFGALGSLAYVICGSDMLESAREFRPTTTLILGSEDGLAHEIMGNPHIYIWAPGAPDL